MKFCSYACFLFFMITNVVASQDFNNEDSFTSSEVKNGFFIKTPLKSSFRINLNITEGIYSGCSANAVVSNKSAPLDNADKLIRYTSFKNTKESFEYFIDVKNVNCEGVDLNVEGYSLLKFKAVPHRAHKIESKHKLMVYYSGNKYSKHFEPIKKFTTSRQ